MSIKPANENRVFRTADFEFCIPEGWQFVEPASRRDRVVFRSADGKSQLALSIIQLEREPEREKARAVLARLIEHRRTAETQPSSDVSLSAYEIITRDGYSYVKWLGREEKSSRWTATLLTMENKKIFTLYVESIGKSEHAIEAIADRVFSSFRAK